MNFYFKIYVFLFISILKNNIFDYYKIKAFFIIILFIICLYIYIYKHFKKNELKRKFSNLFPFQKVIINNYFSNISSKYSNEKYNDALKLISLISLLNFSQIQNNTLKSEIKQQLLNELQTNPRNNNLSEIKFVYLDKTYNFGNAIVLLNNLLYYCEILNISNIYLNSKKNWPISQNITSNKINISIISKKNLDFKNKNIVIFDKMSIYFQRVIKPEIRIDLFKNEIKKNLPKIKINPTDLFIHIRSGDIFRYSPNINFNYAQPPLCFYQSIITNFNYTKIYIISQDKENPIIDILIEKFPNIIFNKNKLEKDVSILVNAYNIVGSISSFFTTLIIINENLENIWEFDNYRLTEKYLHLHRDIYNYKYNYKIYKMYPSFKYKNEMFPWINSRKQINLMIHEKCEIFKSFVYHKKDIKY